MRTCCRRSREPCGLAVDLHSIRKIISRSCISTRQANACRVHCNTRSLLPERTPHHGPRRVILARGCQSDWRQELLPPFASAEAAAEYAELHHGAQSVRGHRRPWVSTRFDRKREHTVSRHSSTCLAPAGLPAIGALCSGSPIIGQNCQVDGTRAGKTSPARVMVTCNAATVAQSHHAELPRVHRGKSLPRYDGTLVWVMVAVLPTTVYTLFRSVPAPHEEGQGGARR
jgi:hypothetical protein